MKKTKRGRALCGLSTLTAMLIILACGIPSTSYLPPVPLSGVVYPLPSETLYTFSAPDPDTTNSDIFEGFEIYYKFFTEAEAADRDVIDENGDTALSASVSKTELVNAGYVRLASAAEIASELPDVPLIELTTVEKDDPDFAVSLNFSNVSPSRPEYLDPLYPASSAGNFRFSRTLANSSGNRILKGFAATDFAAGDSDLPTNFDPAAESFLYITLYVLSYGNNFDAFDFDIYSTAVYIGTTELRLF
jgi:hypothetical protein